MDDGELVERLIAGDPTAQFQLIEQYYEKLSEQFIRQYENVDEGVIEDAVNDVLYKVIENPKQIKKSRGSVGAFIYTAVHNHVIDQYRKKKNRRLISLDGSGKRPEASGESNLLQVVDEYPSFADDSATPTSCYPPEVIQAAQELLNNLQLAEEEREHLRLRRVDKLQPKEIASFLGISPENERIRWFRLKHKLYVEESKCNILVEFKAQFIRQDAVARTTGQS